MACDEGRQADSNEKRAGSGAGYTLSSQGWGQRNAVRTTRAGRTGDTDTPRPIRVFSKEEKRPLSRTHPRQQEVGGGVLKGTGLVFGQFGPLDQGKPGLERFQGGPADDRGRTDRICAVGSAVVTLSA